MHSWYFYRHLDAREVSSKALQTSVAGIKRSQLPDTSAFAQTASKLDSYVARTK